MTTDFWLAALGAANLLLLLWLVWSLRARAAAASADELRALTHAHTDALARLERGLREELGRTSQGTRQELGGTLSNFQQTLLTQQGDVARTQNEQIDSFRTQLAAMQQLMADTLRSSTGALTAQSQAAREAQDAALKRFADAQSEQLRALSDANERRLMEVRTTVEQKLSALAADNEKKLEQMRQTVDEKLHATLEQRLGESFKQVAERLEQVHRGLGEMQTLAQGVGDLKRVLTNVKTRGVFGEMQLAALLEQVFTPEQYAVNVATVPGSRDRVEFAIRLPGRSDDGTPVWLPLDAKFPREDYERLLEAQERADRDGAELAAKALEMRIRDEARTICAKYLAPPHTTDFAVLFVPTEGLYAELLRRPGLVEALQREHRVTLAGPTTLLAMLNSLQMGFRTLALERRSSEVWKVLGAVKTEFSKFGDVLAKVKDQTQSMLNTLDKAEVRTRQMSRALKTVEALPEPDAAGLLPQDVPAEEQDAP
ncbi:DNA recombination protein RmuC [Schlegelella sp. S2-27]|uniref:DNA recombination protein RmuC n=1 Tax=Caldimonas mangrovi TaxID=2944811 RepID=A0ABT0YPZ9_9BURK|nr:DNA recombination protein RmuC [Caldimonas mangrovi]MCM5680404.1 DNA recombination protein RmuC [Caldimonas mangrovi]